MNSTRASESGECDTEPLIRYLHSAGYEVGYYGPIRGYDRNPLPGLHVFPVDFSNLPSVKSEALDNELSKRCDKPVSEVYAWHPDVVLEFPGDKFTWYRPNNDHGVEILDACWRYGFPAGYMYHMTKFKRNWIITDPVLYPRNGEMLYSWPETWPNAILSQEEATWTQIIQGRRVRSHARYAGCENWLTWAMKPREVELDSLACDIVIAGHVHHKRQGQRADHRVELWEGILKQTGDLLVKICGRGWGDLNLPANCEYVGVLPTFKEVMKFMSCGIGGPIVPQKRGFNTSKARFYALNGACPYMFERDPQYKYTYDADARILPLEHESRWDWVQSPKCLEMLPNDVEETIHTILNRTTPNFDILHELIECRADNSDGRFGGYKRV